uniref:Putative secreted protein n=1 Tax=Ixodes ricinus TaxID=34613 RepID=A0A6B0U2X7_IXORI
MTKDGLHHRLIEALKTLVVLGAAALALPGDADVDLGAHQRHGGRHQADVCQALLHHHCSHVRMLGRVAGQV